MSLINILGLTFSYTNNYENIFENVSFQIDTDWKLGFTGRNGRGKTTFLNLLLGKYEYSGKITSSVNFDYFPFEVEDDTQNTIEILYGLNRDLEDWEINRELSLLDVKEDVLYRPFATLSSGEQTKILLVSLFLKENNFLLIDEPTNHLDNEARILVSKYLKSKKSFLLVSHDRLFLDNCIDHILSINKTNIDIQKGNFSSWWETKQLKDNYDLSENIKLQKDIKKLSEAAKRTSAWADKVEKSKNRPLSSGVSADKGYIGHQSAKMMKRSKVIEARQEKAITEKSKLLKNIDRLDELSIKPLKYHSNRLVELDNLSIFYGDKSVCKNINFQIDQSDRIAVKGINGSGKSSILKLLIGQDINYTGNLNISSNINLSYISQDTSHLNGYLSHFARENEIDESLFKAILRKLGFSRIQFEKDMSYYSGGQKKKVLIARSLSQRANLYVWDEPLNYIDVLSRMQIEELILKYKPTMLFVEHDTQFMNKIATKIANL